MLLVLMRIICLSMVLKNFNIIIIIRPYRKIYISLKTKYNMSSIIDINVPLAISVKKD